MKYTEEMPQFLKEYMPTHVHAEIVEAFNERFPDAGFTYKQSRAYVKNHKIKTAGDGRFKKGYTSHNKGKKMSEKQREKAKHTMFKSGHTPHNIVPVGSIVVATVGYHKIKIAEPNKWVFRSRYIWQQEHGDIPKGYALIHMNGVSTDDSIDNLMLISRTELLRLNQDGLFSNDVECNQVAVNIAKVKAKMSEVKRRGRK